MKDIEKFFVLMEIGCSDKYDALTTAKLSGDELFVKIVSTDEKYRKYIGKGTVVIKRLNRSTASDIEEVVLSDVYYVNDSIIRYQKSVAKRKWNSMATKILADDISGRSLLLYLRNKWNELIKNITFKLKT